MKLILKLLGGLAMLVLLLVVVAFFLPRTYRTERSTVINATPEAIYAQVADLKAWKHWSIWHERDPAMKLSYSEKERGVGAWTAWESKSEGNGKMTVTAVEPAKKFVYTLEFPDMSMVSTGSLELQPTSGGVRTVWATQGDLGMNPMSRWFGLFLDGMIGPDFEKGLAKLKRLAEAAPK